MKGWWLAGILFVTTTAYAGELRVHVPNLTADAEGRLGVLIVNLCDNPDCYDHDGEDGHTYLNRQRDDLPTRQTLQNADPVTFTFNDLPTGAYSVVLHHDRDSDGDARSVTCAFGKPYDGVGFSNNMDPRRLWRKPRWKEVKVAVGESDTRLTIDLLYMCD
jgi:uncharacterized protein (DUF2141 family)